jgi:hypothetical protein
MRSSVLAFSIVLAACDAPRREAPLVAPAPAPVPARSPSLVVSGGPVDPPTQVPTRRPGAFANDDPADDLVVGPPDLVADCDDQLLRAGVDYRVATLPVHQERRSKIVCGAPQVVVYAHGPGGITYSPSPLLTCPMALALASFEKVIQEEAARAFHSAVVRIDQLGTYSCREIIAYPGWVSEHSYANAIDLARFTLKNGVSVDVRRDFDLGADAPRRPAGAFLRAVSQRGYDEDIFSHVLTPFFNAAHRNHFHVDLARYRGDGTRPET